MWGDGRELRSWRGSQRVGAQGVLGSGRLGTSWGGWVSLYVLSSSSPPPASFPCNAFLSVICGEGDRGKGGSNGGGGEGTGCQGEGLSSFP